MPDLQDGESVEMKGSGAKPYILKNVGGVYSCTCPAWRNQPLGIERRTCKHLRKLRGDAAEEARIGGALPAKPVKETTEEGEEGSGPPILLAEKWDNAADLTGWWMSEKLDGARAYWDGKQLLTRTGHIYYPPDWFLEGLPETPLDGELWLARKEFNKTMSIVRRQDKSDHWKDIRYVLYDAPSATGGFEERIAFVKDFLASKKPAYALALDQTLCTGIPHLRAELSRVEGLGGEGLMLRQPGSMYVASRSSTLLKVKTFKDDEAVVIGHEPGKGKHKGKLGALAVRLASGVTFSVGTGFSDAERAAPPPIGATITFRYQELTPAGVPRFPSYIGMGIDRPKLVVPATAAEPIVEKPPVIVSLPTPAGATIAGTVAVPAAGTATGTPRYFECAGDKSSKFWEVVQNGCDVTTRWGKVGATGQSKTKTFASEAAATKEVAKLIESKTADGYVEKKKPA
jgi:DNA ligase-1